MPSDSEPTALGDPSRFSNRHADDCSGDDWSCNKMSWIGYVGNSMFRLTTGDFSSINADIVVAFLFLCLCVVSWQFVHFVLQKLMFGKCPVPKEEDFVAETNQISYSNNGGHPLFDENEGIDQVIEAEERRETDVRAAGDSWEQDEYDPDYDANNEIMVMLLQDHPDDADDVNVAVRSENDDENILEELDMTHPEDEAQLVEIESSTDFVANQIEDQNSGTKHENTNVDLTNSGK